ncbi:L-lysine 2,3-aminomutase (EF-P beta-lysylation pathway) [Paenibacillus catalpae]|uniref:L-lysine 2,3-aminomutase (EF-P beta-lysylation pathway) n=1 Tax=Paenibacillus catalpae TaxID=1045775 RepID=A0A1I1WXN8_9BACL|nr:KamA family radical SAM protein [Paenibacillus catalpae]SFD99897.1 L-lysine 2,3-aminomutase (EF-P beta-lysylation pathway) [Paenibacillus catalpae]
MVQPIADNGRTTGLSEAERERLKKHFRVNDYYLNLIDWDDPKDPIRKHLVASAGEAHHGTREDDREAYGFMHLYQSMVLLPVSQAAEGLAYIAEHNEIHKVVLTGGDCLMLGTSKLRWIIEQLREIEHVGTIRLDSRLPVFNPMRIYEDQELLDLIHKNSSPEKRIYVMTTINHPREITAEAKKAFNALHQAGAVVMNQTPIVKGVNNDPLLLVKLIDQLSQAGVTPYSFVINRPNPSYPESNLSLQTIYSIVQQAKELTAELGQKIRLQMAHTDGKIELLDIEGGKAYVKYHHYKEEGSGQFMMLDCPPEASWLDDLSGHDDHIFYLSGSPKVNKGCS